MEIIRTNIFHQLLAWAVGDFDYVEALTERKYQGKSIPVRVYTTKGLKEQARFALECAHRTVDYFSEVFEIEYPLPKADLLAVHEFVSFPFLSHPADPKFNDLFYFYIRLWEPWKIGALLHTAQLLYYLTRESLILDIRIELLTSLRTVSLIPIAKHSIRARFDV